MSTIEDDWVELPGVGYVKRSVLESSLARPITDRPVRVPFTPLTGGPFIIEDVHAPDDDEDDDEDQEWP